MKNIGPKSWEMMSHINVRSDDDIQALGPVSIFVRLKAKGLNPSLNLLDALAMGMQGRHFTDISDEEKQRLRLEVEDQLDLEKDFLASIQ